MTRTEIPKDCVVCDVCNKATTDGNFKAVCYMEWYSSRLLCDECSKKYQWRKNKEMKETFIDEFQEGDDLSQTDLARPIVITTGEELSDKEIIEGMITGKIPIDGEDD